MIVDVLSELFLSPINRPGGPLRVLGTRSPAFELVWCLLLDCILVDAIIELFFSPINRPDGPLRVLGISDGLDICKLLSVELG